MRIAVDLQSCQSGSRLGGIGRYSIELAKAMLRNGKGHEFWFLLSNLLPQYEADIRFELSNLIPQDQIAVFSVPPKVAAATGNAARIKSAELIREEFLCKLRPDIVHVSSLIEGLSEDVVTSVGLIFPSERTAVTLYDLIPYVQQSVYLEHLPSLRHYLAKIEYLKRAGLLLAISEHSRQEAIRELGTRSDDVINISSAADSCFHPVEMRPKDAAKLRSRYGIRNKFVMYTSSFDQRKNQPNLIKAFGCLPMGVRSEFQLVIVGNGWDSIYSELKAVGRLAGLGDDDLIFTGRVTDEDHLLLLNLCDLFIFPSLAEGFGLPVLEAMSCGRPTICSNCTSLPEVIGWEEAQFDPRDSRDIARVMERAITDTQFRNELVRRGTEHAKIFSWDKSAKIALEGFDRVSQRAKALTVQAGLRTQKSSSDSLPDIINGIAEVEMIDALPDEAVRELASCIGTNRQRFKTLTAIHQLEHSKVRVGWVTTWNTRCGIAAYSKYLVNEFPAVNTIFAPVVDWTTHPDDSSVRRCWINGGSDNLRELFAEICRDRIEIVILQFNYGFFDFPSLSDLLLALSGKVIRTIVVFHSTTDPSTEKTLKFLVPALSTCHALVVHSRKDIDRLADVGLRGKLCFLAHGMPAALTRSNPDRHREKIILATYGFALPGKGLMETLEAFAILEREDPGKYQLLLINSEYPVHQSSDLVKEISDRIAELGLVDKVTLETRFLSDEETLAYLQTASLIIYAYQRSGESSSAAVRMGLAAGRPVAVTPLSVFDDVAGAVFTLSGFDPKVIAQSAKLSLELIKKEDPQATAIRDRAELWRLSHTHASVARYLYWKVVQPVVKDFQYDLPATFDLTSSGKPITFRASDAALKTVCGSRGGESITSTGKAGNLLHGPFISIGPGSYVAAIRGSVTDRGVPRAYADVVVNAGNQILSRSELGLESGAGNIVQLQFDVPERGCKDLEVRIFVGEETRMKIDAVVVAPRMATSSDRYHDRKSIEIAHKSSS